MKKRILAALVCAAMVMSLAGCSNNGGNDVSYVSKTPSSDKKDKDNSSAESSSAPADSGDTSSAEESKPSEPDYPEPTSVLYAQGEKLDFPETPLSDLKYEIRGDYAYITEYFGKSSDVRLPATIEGKQVRIDSGRHDEWFEDHDAIKRLILPDGIFLAGQRAENACHSIESIAFLGSFSYKEPLIITEKINSVYFYGDIPERTVLENVFSRTSWYKTMNGYDGLVVLDDILFTGRHCTGDVVVPKGVKKIDDEAFMDSELDSIVLPEGLETIGKNAFSNSALNSITLPEGLKTIGEGAFGGTKLSSVKIPTSVISINKNAFSNTPYLKSITNDDRLAIDGKWLLDGNSAYGHITVPNGVTHIADYAFYEAKLQSVTFPEGIENIGERAFQVVEKEITIPDNFNKLTYAGYQAFRTIFDLDDDKNSDMVVFGSVAVIGHITENGKTITIPDGVKCVSNAYGVTTSSMGLNVSSYPLASLTLPDSINVYSGALANCAEIITYKGNTYHTRASNPDYLAERAALQAAIEGK